MNLIAWSKYGCVVITDRGTSNTYVCLLQQRENATRITTNKYRRSTLEGIMTGPLSFLQCNFAGARICWDESSDDWLKHRLKGWNWHLQHQTTLLIHRLFWRPRTWVAQAEHETDVDMVSRALFSWWNNIRFALFCILYLLEYFIGSTPGTLSNDDLRISAMYFSSFISILALLVLQSLSITGALSNVPTCYNFDRSVAKGNYACNLSANVTSCCGIGSICLDNKVCQNGNNQIIRGACTDPTWTSPECPNYCTGEFFSFSMICKTG